MNLIEFNREGIYCAAGNFYIDPWLPVDYAIITHGHSDHARWGSKNYLCHTYTRPILEFRLGADNSYETLDYGESKYINGVKVSLHPAGHIVGSAQVRIAYKGYVAVVSGDYKTENDGISGVFEPIKCNTFVTESTFGLPIYNWLSQEEIFDNIKDWIYTNQKRNKTSILVAYSLGKAQRLMKGLDGVANIFVHAAIGNMNKAIQKSGILLPAYQLLHETEDKQQLQNQVVIVTSALLDTNVIKKIPNGATAICSGWMHVRGSRRWQSVDAGFAVSDHADWGGLLNSIKATQAETVYVTHGFQSTFAKYLNELGINAHEVSTQFGHEEAEETTTEKAEIINNNQDDNKETAS